MPSRALIWPGVGIIVVYLCTSARILKHRPIKCILILVYIRPEPIRPDNLGILHTHSYTHPSHTHTMSTHTMEGMITHSTRTLRVIEGVYCNVCVLRFEMSYLAKKYK